MIRRSSLLCGCILFSLIVSAQFKKGTMFTGANIASGIFESSEKEVSFPAPTEGYTLKENNLDFTFAPYLAKFISNNTALGLGFNISVAHAGTTYEAANGNTFRKDEEDFSDAGLQVFLRRYFFLKGDQPQPLSVYAQVGISGGHSSLSTEGFVYGSDYKDSYKGKSSGGFFITPGIGVGINKRFRDRVAIELGFETQYRFSKYDIKTTTLRDELINGSIDQTFINEPTYKQKKQTIALNIGFIFFFSKRE
ncbi:MAG TPA: hypothetical protein VHM26_17845 [Chitinophagaceae bacterium]|nr:hypothetical protein [Chitinophagaceae bacterium]